ncbi:MAG: zf-HC2 domain-containing protein [bacterium]
MDCQHWQDQLDDFLAEKLAPEQLREAREHLAGCRHCQELLVTVRGNLDTLSSREETDLTHEILSLTSGSPCGRAEELLGDLVAGTLPPTETQLVRAHLEHCTPCQELVVTLTWVLPELQTMDRIEPDAAFTADVLRATSGARERPLELLARLGQWWQRQIVRPRFALEAAYVGTMVLIALFGTPLSPFKRVPEQALTTVQAGPSNLFSSVTQPVATLGRQLSFVGESVWDATSGVVHGGIESVSTGLAERRQRTAPALAELRGQGEMFLNALSEGDFVQSLHHLGELPDGIQRCWSEWCGSEGRSPPDSTDSGS